MGVILFFTMALFIFLGGVTVISVTFYHWYKTAKESKSVKVEAKTSAP